MIASSTTSVRSRRRSARGLLSIAIGLWLAGPGCSLAAEVISSFDSDVRLAKDGELTVTETVRVQAEGRDIRHGIYRDFPLTFKDAGGVIREVDFSLISVERDGRPEEYSTTRERGIIRIYAGSKSTIVPGGEHTYVFPLSDGTAGALVRRQTGAELERDREFLAFPDHDGELSPAICR
ncbi:MAG: DUF2207 domain-containing protein, partial [Pseudolabrys sp.]